jgi:hypothetical protein
VKPTIGRIVLYQRHGSPNGQHKAEPSPAVVTRVLDADAGVVDLFVMNPTGVYFDVGTKHDPCDAPDRDCSDWTPGHWRWPPRT